jgi:hypothetical protein
MDRDQGTAKLEILIEDFGQLMLHEFSDSAWTIGHGDKKGKRWKRISDGVAGTNKGLKAKKQAEK